MLIKGARIQPENIKERMLESVDNFDIILNDMKQYVSFDESYIKGESAVEFFVAEESQDTNKIEPKVTEAPVQGLSLFMQYNNFVAIEITRYLNQETKKLRVITRATAVKSNNNKIYKHKLIYEGGSLVRENEIETDHPEIEFFGDALLQTDNNKITLADLSDPDEFWGVPCFDIDPAHAECCQFRYGGLPWNELVEYNYCGAGCTRRPLEPVNPLDACCQSHDVCYGKHYNSCSCDEDLLACAEDTDEAGGSRLIFAFEAKTSLGFCS